MLCKYCGRQIEDDSVFCRFCGKKMKKDDPAKKRRRKAPPETAAWMEGSHYRAAALKAMPRKRSKTPLIIGAVVLAAVAVVLYFVFFRH